MGIAGNDYPGAGQVNNQVGGTQVGGSALWAIMLRRTRFRQSVSIGTHRWPSKWNHLFVSEPQNPLNLAGKCSGGHVL